MAPEIIIYLQHGDMVDGIVRQLSYLKSTRLTTCVHNLFVAKPQPGHTELPMVFVGQSEALI